ncbi:hypothetical protein P3T36_006312 [Kitasatospora sp. MAP12-15]|uniref:hypothetical protein n=1 Tax=unclassified Kitasatospora TaxID=2633591 RepID=UPI002475F604|nr:hypothetical protein [Kitasatospora sp. MAP12-44]MDH6107853.1 hypothetical protein [Kitasatospora sp. MAP12-44]
MKYGSVRNSGGADVLFDVAVGAACGRPACQNTVPVVVGRGRPAKWCSTACKSKAARDKIKAEEEAAKAAAGLDQDQAEQAAVGARVELLRLAELAVDAARTFLHAVNADPVAAYEEFYRRHASLGVRAQEAAEDARDAVRWPDLTGWELELRRAEETLMRPDVLARVSPELKARTSAEPVISDRSEKPVPADPSGGSVISGRSEKASVLAGSAVPAVSDRSQKRPARVTGAPVPMPAAALPASGGWHPDGTGSSGEREELEEAARRRAFTDPTLRFGVGDRVEDLSITFGAGWTLESWTRPDADGVFQLVHPDGLPVGWTAPLPDGPWGLGGWVALRHRADGRTAEVLTGDLGRPRTHLDYSEALEALMLADAAHRPPTVPTGPRPALKLKRPTGWTVPTERGLGTPSRSALGGALVHLIWPRHHGVQALERSGRVLGWIEEYDVERGIWAALIDSSIVADDASGEPLLCATSTDALTLLRRALVQELTL